MTQLMSGKTTQEEVLALPMQSNGSRSFKGRNGEVGGAQKRTRKDGRGMRGPRTRSKTMGES
jgi:hypothetical protein